MRWMVFIVAACLAVALDMGLSGAMTLRTLGFITPSFAGCLVAFIALFGRTDCVLWGAWILGLITDLTPGSMEGSQLVFIIGPHALGFTLGAWIILTIRSMVFKNRILTVAVCTMLCVLSSGFVMTIIGLVRYWLPFTGGEVVPFGLGELARVTGDAILSGVLAIPVGWVLFQLMPLWRFDYGVGRRSTV
jgi:cell shape-determining protein MreD